MALPFPDDSFDAAVMALVIFFVPDPAKGVAEMARVVRPGGTIAAYAWDILGGGFPLEPMQAEMRAMGVEVALPPSPGASRMEALRELWRAAGLEGDRDAGDHRAAELRRLRGLLDHQPAVLEHRPAQLPPWTASDLERLKARVRARLPADAADASPAARGPMRSRGGCRRSFVEAGASYSPCCISSPWRRAMRKTPR